MLRRKFGGCLLSLGMLVTVSISPLQAQTTQPSPPSREVQAVAKPSRDWYPFRGEVAAVDKGGARLHLKRKQGTRPVRVETSSEVLRDGKPVPLGDIKVGEYMHGKMKRAGGEEVVHAAVLDPEPPARQGSTRARRAPAAGRPARDSNPSP